MQVGVRVVGRAGDGGASDAVASGDLSALRAALAGGDDGGPALGTEGLGTVDVEAINLVNVRPIWCASVSVCVCVSISAFVCVFVERAMPHDVAGGAARVGGNGGGELLAGGGHGAHEHGAGDVGADPVTIQALSDEVSRRNASLKRNRTTVQHPSLKSWPPLAAQAASSTTGQAMAGQTMGSLQVQVGQPLASFCARSERG